MIFFCLLRRYHWINLKVNFREITFHISKTQLYIKDNIAQILTQIFYFSSCKEQIKYNYFVLNKSSQVMTYN